MSLFSNSNSAVNETDLILDVTTSSIGGALVHFEKNKKPQILYSTRSYFPLQDSFDYKRFLTSLDSQLKIVLSNIALHGIARAKLHLGKTPKIQRVLSVVASPISVTNTKNIKTKTEKPFSISNDFLEKILNRAETEFQNEVSKKENEMKGVGAYSIVEKKIVQTHVQGYPTNTFYMKETDDFEVSLFMGAVPKEILEKITKAVHHVWSAKIHFNTLPLVSFSMIRDMYPENPYFLFGDISGDAMDITLVKNAIPIQSTTILEGRSFPIREISQKLKLLPQIAESYLKMYLDGTADEETKKKLTELVSTLEDRWSALLHAGLLNLSDEIVFPRDFFITVNSDLERFFLNAIEKESVNTVNADTTGKSEPFTTTILDEEKFESLITLDSTMTKDIFLFLETLFLQKIILLGH